MNYFDLIMSMLRNGANQADLIGCIEACKDEIRALQVNEAQLLNLLGKKSSACVPDHIVVLTATLASAAMKDYLPEAMLVCTAYLRNDPDLLNALHRQEPQVTICEDEDAECPIPTVNPAPRKKYSRKSEKV